MREFGEYNAGSSKFISYYGSIILIISMPIFMILRNKLYFEKLSSFQKNFLHINFYLIILLPIIYIVIDYMYILASRSWMKTRLLEIPIYFLLITSLIFIFSSKDRFFKSFVSIFLLINSIGPVFYTNKFQQLIYNYSIFLKIFN